jgi:hypothetical protein
MVYSRRIVNSTKGVMNMRIFAAAAILLMAFSAMAAERVVLFGEFTSTG